MPLLNRGGLSPRRDQVDLFSRVVIDAAGTTIARQTTKRYSGMVVARTGVGTFTLTLDKTAAKYAELLCIDLIVIGANATYTNSRGIQPFITGDLTSGGVITFKLTQTVDGSVNDLEGNAIMLIRATLSLSAAAVA